MFNVLKDLIFKQITEELLDPQIQRNVDRFRTLMKVSDQEFINKDKLINDIVVFLTQYTEIDLLKSSLYLKSIADDEILTLEFPVNVNLERGPKQIILRFLFQRDYPESAPQVQIKFVEGLIVSKLLASRVNMFYSKFILLNGDISLQKLSTALITWREHFEIVSYYFNFFKKTKCIPEIQEVLQNHFPFYSGSQQNNIELHKATEVNVNLSTTPVIIPLIKQDFVNIIPPLIGKIAPVVKVSQLDWKLHNDFTKKVSYCLIEIANDIAQQKQRLRSMINIYDEQESAMGYSMDVGSELDNSLPLLINSTMFLQQVVDQNDHLRLIAETLDDYLVVEGSQIIDLWSEIRAHIDSFHFLCSKIKCSQLSLEVGLEVPTMFFSSIKLCRSRSGDLFESIILLKKVIS